jgi:hypothetical protein
LRQRLRPQRQLQQQQRVENKVPAAPLFPNLIELLSVRSSAIIDQNGGVRSKRNNAFMPTECGHSQRSPDQDRDSSAQQQQQPQQCEQHAAAALVTPPLIISISHEFDQQIVRRRRRQRPR